MGYPYGRAAIDTSVRSGICLIRFLNQSRYIIEGVVS